MGVYGYSDWAEWGNQIIHMNKWSMKAKREKKELKKKINISSFVCFLHSLPLVT